MGFERSEMELCLYSKTTSKDVQYMSVYADGLLITDQNKVVIRTTADRLQKVFELTRLGELKNHLGIDVRRDSDGVHWID